MTVTAMSRQIFGTSCWNCSVKDVTTASLDDLARCKSVTIDRQAGWEHSEMGMLGCGAKPFAHAVHWLNRSPEMSF